MKAMVNMMATIMMIRERTKRMTMMMMMVVVVVVVIGSLSNDDGDCNEDGKKAIGKDWQKNVARASRFFVHFFAVAAQLRRETS